MSRILFYVSTKTMHLINKIIYYTQRLILKLTRTVYQRVVPRKVRDLIWRWRDSYRTEYKRQKTAPQKDTIADARDIGDEITALVNPLIVTKKYLQYFDQWQEAGFHITPNHFYQPIPDTRTLVSDDMLKSSALLGINMNEDNQLFLLRDVFPQFANEYNDIRHDKPATGHQFYMKNGMFGGTDALVLYCMIRHFKPGRILEIGSGFSTMVSIMAIRENKSTEITCIEPYPPAHLLDYESKVSKIIQKEVQDLDYSVFEELKPGDFLFIDSTHVSKAGSDVNYLYHEVLPRLQPGVFVHIHDIFLPKDYPPSWLIEQKLFWNEQYLLRAFLMFNSEFEVIFANHFMQTYHKDALQQTFPKSNWWGGGSFWIRRINK